MDSWVSIVTHGPWYNYFQFHSAYHHDLNVYYAFIHTCDFKDVLCLQLFERMMALFTFFDSKSKFSQSVKQLFSGSTSLLGQYQVIITCIKDFYANKSVYSTIILNVCEPISRLWHFFHCETATAVRGQLMVREKVNARNQVDIKVPS